MASFIKKLNLSNLEQKTSKRSYSEAFGDDEKSPISILMEYAQKRGSNPPEFRWLEAEKKDESQEWIFTCYVKLNDVEAIGKGENIVHIICLPVRFYVKSIVENFWIAITPILR